MFLLRLLYLILLQQGAWCWKYKYFDRKPYANSLESIQRLYSMLKGYELDTRNKLDELDVIKSFIEMTPQYETGYIVAEIIEKYRLMVKETTAAEALISNEMTDYMIKASHIQNYYLELWHLCMMLHEIPQKYGKHADDAIVVNPHITEENREAIKEYFQAKREEEMKVQKEKEIKVKEKQKEREKQLEKNEDFEKKMKDDGQYERLKDLVNKFYPYGSGTTKNPNSTRPWWPIEYGWEIDTTWFDRNENFGYTP